MPEAGGSDKGGVDKLRREFVAESLEALDRMDQCLTDLETRPHDAGLMAEIFRAVHTIKGSTGFLGFGRLETVAHAGEHLLGGLRDGRLTATADLINGLLQLMDRMREILSVIDVTGAEGARVSDDDADLLMLLKVLDSAEPRSMAGAQKPMQAVGTIGSPGSNDRTLRVDVEVLNRMMNLVGELVLTRNQLLQSGLVAQSFPQLGRRLDSVTCDLRETVMRARMQPVGHVFSKFPRMVRDLARGCGKQVRISFAGQETGLDKSLIEAVKDPLTHALRNAIDHGLETPQRRLDVGKSAEGMISLSAFHHNGSVVIEVTDDGGGMVPATLIAKALEQGLIDPARAAAMSDRDALQLVFLPGFSTADQVTHVSGRGVGMDVVRANLEKVGGTVELESFVRKGTTVRLRVPLTLAIMRALVVRSAGNRFCLPQGALLELVYVPLRECECRVEQMGSVELFRLRERLIPMVRLNRLLDLKAEEDDGHGFYIVVLESEGCTYGLVVDDLEAPEEIVVKPLSAVLREIGLFSGATVLGSGMLALILDAGAIGQRAEVGKQSDELADKPIVAELAKAEQTPFLIFEEACGGPDGRAPARGAVPLDAVERIETMPVDAIEFVNGRPMLQYRGELLAVEDRGGVLAQCMRQEEQEVTLIICLGQGSGRGSVSRFAMAVGRVVDVAEGDLIDAERLVHRERLALVSERLTAVHQGFPAGFEMQEVA